MTVVLDHQTEGVTLGVLDKALTIANELHATTFIDLLGAVHTVFAHKEGPFQTVDDVVTAFEKGLLHPFATHEEAIAHARTTGDDVFADRLAAHAPPKREPETTAEGEGY